MSQIYTILFDTALQDWGWVSGIAIVDSGEYGTGNMLMYAQLNNPRIIYCSITGFGQDGPYGKRGGVDQIAQGMGGMMSVTGLPEQGPVRAGVAISDILKTANAVQSTLDNAVNAVQDIAGLSDSALGLFDFQNPSVSAPGFKSPLGECYAGPPELGGCGGTKIKLFGGKGLGGSASAIFGNLAAIADGGRGLTGSVIGVDLVNGGGGYTFPPFVEIVDECGRGIGATARAEVDYDPDSPTYQEIIDIRIITPGFGYTLSSDNDDEYVFDDVRGPQIVSGGEDYDPETTTVTDSQGNTYICERNGNGIRIVDSKGVMHTYAGTGEPFIVHLFI